MLNLPEKHFCRIGSILDRVVVVAGLRERKKQHTRLALSWAAIRLVVERGLDGARIEDIADEAGVSVRTFRNYFPTKADAIAYRHKERTLRIAAALRDRPAGEPLWEALSQAVLARFALDAADAGGRGPDAEWTAGVRIMVAEPALQGALRRADAAAADALAAAVAERTGTDRDALYPRLVAAAVGAAVGVASEQWLRSDPPRPLGPLLAEALDLLSSGLEPPSSREDA
ncbi:TetR family transcriptional regulator [Pseudonocardia xishanensis]|uniref:TetR family transcriptional regulator n=1 Tax=Pseudonocardia xishanensis TaxID=630995 RepID=A0ABP8S2F7_9PSEU